MVPNALLSPHPLDYVEVYDEVAKHPRNPAMKGESSGWN